MEQNLAWEFLRLALAIVVVLVLPGLLILDLTRVVPKGLGRLALLPLAFSVSTAFVSLIGLIGYALNVGLVVAESIILGSVALFLLLKLVWVYGRVRGINGRSVVLPPLRLADGAVVVSVALLAALAAWVGIWLSHTADSFYHIAGITALLADDSVLVERVLYADSPGGLDPIAGTWHLALALVSNIGEIDPIFLFDQLPPAMVILLGLAFFSFARVLLRNPWWALAATLVQFIVVFQLDFRTSPYPNIISFVVLWTALLVLFKLLQSGERRGLLMVGALGFALAGLHLFTFELLILSIVGYGLGVYVVSRRRRQLRGDVANVALVFGLVSVVSLPFLIMKIEGSFIVMASGFPDGRDFRDIGLLFDGLDRFPPLSYLGDTVLSPITSLNASKWIADNSFVFVPDRIATPWGLSSYGGPLLFGALAYSAVLFLLPTAFAGRREHIFLVVTTLAVPVVLLNPAIVSPLTGRVSDIPLLRLPNLAPFALVAIAISAPVLTRLWRIGMCRVSFPLLVRYLVTLSFRAASWLRLKRLAPAVLVAPAYALVALSLLVGFGIAMGLDLYRGTADGYISSYEGRPFGIEVSRESRLSYEDGLYGYLRGEVPAGSVVLSDMVTSYYVGGLTGLPVVAVPPTHSMKRVEGVDGPQRRADVSSVLNPDNSDLPTTIMILDKYDVSFIVTTDESIMERWPDTFQLLYRDDSASVFSYLLRSGSLVPSKL